MEACSMIPSRWVVNCEYVCVDAKEIFYTLTVNEKQECTSW